jgi:hypothetical protein
VELHDVAVSVEAEIIESDFAGEIVEVAISGVFASRDDGGATAVPAA